MLRRLILAVAGVLILAGPFVVTGTAQRELYEMQRMLHDLQTKRRPPEGTEFIFARVRFSGGNRGGFFGFGGMPGWAHDYPEAEEHILQVADEATGLNVNKLSYVIVDLDSEELFDYPFVYISEPAEMDMNEKEVANLREYFNRGGFAMVDDFDRQWELDWLASQMRKVFPDRVLTEMTIDHPIYHTFYEVPTLDVASPYPNEGPPKFYGYFDEKGRLVMIVNHNTDIGDFWEWVDQPMYPLEPSTEALRFGINYFMYALTH
jgi:hypothetical protein